MRSFARSLLGLGMSFEKSLAEICEFKNSLRRPVTAADRKPGPYPYYGAATIQDWVAEYLFEGLHLLVGEDGTVQTPDGRPMLQLVDGKFWVNNHAHVLKCSNDLDTRFLGYALNQVSITPYVTGAAQPKVNMGNLKKVLVPWPSQEKRQRISEIGKALDDRITLLRETNKTLEAIAQAIFKSWFIDFDPVRAKMEGRAPAGMDEETAALFPDELVESDLGLVPKGWDASSIEEICSTITNGGTPRRTNKSYWDAGNIPWYRTGDFLDGFLLKPNEKITEAGLAESSVKLLPENAVLMAIYAAPTVGRLGVLTRPSTFNQACTGMVAKNDVGTWFLYWTLFFGRDWFNARANGAAQQNISKAIVARYVFPKPTYELLGVFHNLADSIHRKVRSNVDQAETLTTIRKSLLPKIISGKLHILRPNL